MTTIFRAMLRADGRRSRTWRWNAGRALSVAALGLLPLVGCAEADPNAGNLALGDGAQSGDQGSVSEFESDVKELKQALSPGGSNVTAQLTVPLRQAFSRTFRPSGTQAVIVRMDQLAANTNPMLAVLRWTNRQAWETGSVPDRNSQAAFDVVAFNDDDTGLAPRAAFVPDGRSYYTVFVMPYSDASTWGSGRLKIENCIGCNFQQVVPVQGYTLRGNTGNVVQVNTTSGVADPWVFAMRLFASTNSATLLRGVGMANDQGLKGNTNNRSNLHTTFSLEGQSKDLIFVTNVAATTGSPAANLLIGTEAPLPGLATRPPNNTCIAPATQSAISDNLAATGCLTWLLASRWPGRFHTKSLTASGQTT